MLAGSDLQTVFFDKTGTLTENEVRFKELITVVKNKVKFSLRTISYVNFY